MSPYHPFIALWTQSPPGTITNPHNVPECYVLHLDLWFSWQMWINTWSQGTLWSLHICWNQRMQISQRWYQHILKSVFCDLFLVIAKITTCQWSTSILKCYVLVSLFFIHIFDKFTKWEILTFIKKNFEIYNFEKW